MCFSAEASFGLSGLLLPAGSYCILSAIRKTRSLIPLSILPMVFGIQQVCEGFVWLGIIQQNAPMVRVSSLIFLFFAMSFWPCWVPFSVLIGHASVRIRWIFAIIALVGLIGGLGAYLPLLLDSEMVNAEIAFHSINYNISESPAFDIVPMGVWQLGYIAIMMTPFFVSLPKALLPFGMAFVISTVVSHFVFWYAFASVWCFFAAILSLYLCWFFRSLPYQPNVQAVTE